MGSLIGDLSIARALRNAFGLVEQKGGPEKLATDEVQPVVDVIRLQNNIAAPPPPPATPNSGIGTRLGFSTQLIGDGVNAQFNINIIGANYNSALFTGPQWPTNFTPPGGVLTNYRYVIDALEIGVTAGVANLDGKTWRLRLFAEDGGDPTTNCAYIHMKQWARFNPDAQGRNVFLALGGSSIAGGFEGAGYAVGPWASSWTGVHLCDNPGGSSMGLYCIVDTLEGTVLPAGVTLTLNVLARRGENGGLPILFP